MGGLNEMRRCFQPRQWFLDDEGAETEGDVLMWISRPTEDGRWMVGYWYPDGVTWHTDSTYPTQELANKHIRWIYGGND